MASLLRKAYPRGWSSLWDNLGLGPKLDLSGVNVSNHKLSHCCMAWLVRPVLPSQKDQDAAEHVDKVEAIAGGAGIAAVADGAVAGGGAQEANEIEGDDNGSPQKGQKTTAGKKNLCFKIVFDKLPVFQLHGKSFQYYRQMFEDMPSKSSEVVLEKCWRAPLPSEISTAAKSKNKKVTSDRKLFAQL